MATSLAGSEAMLDAYGVTEAHWRDGTARSPHFAISESPALPISTAVSPTPGGTSPKFRTRANPPTPPAIAERRIRHRLVR